MQDVSSCNISLCYYGVIIDGHATAGMVDNFVRHVMCLKKRHLMVEFIFSPMYNLNMQTICSTAPICIWVLLTEMYHFPQAAFDENVISCL